MSYENFKEWEIKCNKMSFADGTSMSSANSVDQSPLGLLTALRAGL